MDTTTFWQDIKQYDQIVIFRHVRPDFDACGSQMGLKEIILANWPNKKVKAAGYEQLDNPLFNKSDEVSDDEIKNSLAIILDTSIANRVDDGRYKTALKSIRIDHHPFQSAFTDNEMILPEASSTCQIITALTKSEKLIMPKPAADFLYTGMSHDTVKFTIAKVGAETFNLLAYLSQCGLDIVKVNRAVYAQTEKQFKFVHWLGNQVKIEGHLAYVIVNLSEILPFGITVSQAKDQVTVMNDIAGVTAWVLIAETKEGDYSASLRSVEVPISDVAAQFGGGGHALASGIPHLTLAQSHQLIEQLAQLINKNDDNLTI